MTEKELIDEFGEWFVMTKKDVLCFDALMQSMSCTHKNRQPLIILNTADRKNMTDNDYIAGLEAAIDHWRKQYERASERAAYWAKMYDELTEIKNSQLDDDDEVTVDDE